MQNSPAFRGACFFIVGILAGVWSGCSPSSLFIVLFSTVVVSALLIWLARYSNHLDTCLSLCVALLWILFGAAKAVTDSSSYLSTPAEFLNTRVAVQGTLSDITSKSNSARCVLKCETLIGGRRKVSFHSTILATITDVRSRLAGGRLKYGTVIQLEGTLSRPPGGRNPGEFDLRKYYAANGIDLLMLVRKKDSLMVLDSLKGSWLLREVVVPTRAYLDRLFASTMGGEESELLKGILIGERSGLSASTRIAFTNAGVAHVLAVSGSNVAFIATALFLVLEFLRLARCVRVLLTAAGVVFFMLLSGGQPAVTRATIMALVFLAGSLIQQKPDPYNSLGLSAILILCIDSRQLLDVGFQLSFAAVLSIIYLYPLANRAIRRWETPSFQRRVVIWTLRICAVSAVATLGTLPLTATYFGKISIIGIAANVLVIPIVGLSVVLGMVTSIAGLLHSGVADVYASVNLILLRLTLVVTSQAANLPFATVDTYQFKSLHAVPFYLAVGLVFHLHDTNLTRKFVTLLLSSLNLCAYWPGDHSPVGGANVRVSFIDVGQGDALLIELPEERRILIDAGPWSSEFDAGERIVVPFLKRRGIQSIDFLIVSHPDADHVGGVASVLRHFRVRGTIDNGVNISADVFLRYQREREASGCTPTVARQGQQLLPEEWDARLYVLSPLERLRRHDSTDGPHSLNDASLVLKFQYKHFSLLTVGDAGVDAEARMIETYGDFLNSSMLKVGHHGSSTSSSPEFIGTVRARYAVISVGRLNRFNHPSPRVTELLRNNGVKTLRTDEEGAVIFDTDGEDVRPVNWLEGA